MGEDIPHGAVAVGAGAIGADPGDERQPFVEGQHLFIGPQRVVPEVAQDLIRLVEHGTAIRGLDAG